MEYTSKDGRISSSDKDFIRRIDLVKGALDLYVEVDQYERDLIERGEAFSAGIASQRKTTIVVELVEALEGDD